ncbi:MAG: hemin receptor [Prevotella sp.]|nr:hemin receptor [Prevotella sp.]
MKKLLVIAAFSLAVLPMAAQETYENAAVATQDLNGSARYVGMGGAMEALGADISTIGTNPAGIGLFRHSMVSASMGMLSQQGAKTYGIADKNKVSFDQVGFVYARQTGENSFMNLGFNYHKSRNFSQIVSAADRLSGASSNKLSYIKGDLGLLGLQYSNSEWLGNSNAFNQIDYLNYNALMYDEDDDTFYYNEANGYTFNNGVKGHVNDFDFNISGNINDKVFLGFTVGIKDVDYQKYSEYSESLLTGRGDPVGNVIIKDSRTIEGTGFDIKAGVTFRPIEESPFRIALYVHTPTWYDLKTSNYTTLTNNTTVGLYDNGYSEERYDFKLYTPWKFGASVGHTFGSSLAIGATYEFADYAHLDSRVNTGESYDWYYDTYTESSEHDFAMNDHTKQCLNGVHTLKVGAELKADENFAVRLGYNFISPMYSKDAYKDGSIDSPGSYYASSTDYTNWKATNRITAGIGYNIGKLSMDLAYQYTAQSGDFSPFMNYWDDTDRTMDNVCNSVKVDNNRHQLLFTLGYHF